MVKTEVEFPNKNKIIKNVKTINFHITKKHPTFPTKPYSFDITAIDFPRKFPRELIEFHKVICSDLNGEEEQGKQLTDQEIRDLYNNTNQSEIWTDRKPDSYYTISKIRVTGENYLPNNVFLLPLVIHKDMLGFWNKIVSLNIKSAKFFFYYLIVDPYNGGNGGILGQINDHLDELQNKVKKEQIMIENVKKFIDYLAVAKMLSGIDEQIAKDTIRNLKVIIPIIEKGTKKDFREHNIVKDLLNPTSQKNNIITAEAIYFAKRMYVTLKKLFPDDLEYFKYIEKMICCLFMDENNPELYDNINKQSLKVITKDLRAKMKQLDKYIW